MSNAIETNQLQDGCWTYMNGLIDGRRSWFVKVAGISAIKHCNYLFEKYHNQLLISKKLFGLIQICNLILCLCFVVLSQWAQWAVPQTISIYQSFENFFYRSSTSISNLMCLWFSMWFPECLSNKEISF